MDFIEQGTITMPAVRNEPLEMLAPTLLMSCTTSAIASTSLTEYGVLHLDGHLAGFAEHQMGFDLIHLAQGPRAMRTP